MRNILVFSGSSHPDLTELICNRLGITPSPARLSKFSNLETNVEIRQSVRDQDVYIVQSGCGRVNDHVMELMIMIAACKTASAASVTAVIPCFPYARQSDGVFRAMAPDATWDDVQETTPCVAKKEGVTHGVVYKEWSARPGTLVANMLTAAGAHHVITMDLHDPQFQGYFDIPVDVVYAEPTILNYIRLNVEEYRHAVIVSPDAGGAKRATSVAMHLGMEFALIHRDGNRRQPSHGDEKGGGMTIVGNVKGRKCIIVDDMVDTGRTLCKAAKTLKLHEAKEVICIVTHGILSPPPASASVHSVLEMLERSDVDRLVVTNTIPQDGRGKEAWMTAEERERWTRWRKEGRFEVIDVSGILAEAIRRSHNGESVSYLYRDL